MATSHDLLAAGPWLVPPGVDPPRPGADDVLVVHAFAAGLVESALLETALLALVAEAPPGVALVGLHVPRDAHEAEPARVAGWRDELGAAHPILLDEDAAVARGLGVPGLPSALVLDARGRTIATVAGHDRAEEIAGAIGLALAEAAAGGRRRQPPAARAPATPSPTALRRPGGVAVDPERGLVAVADTAHHRVVIATADGRVLRTTGAGAPGHRDGRGGHAAFRGPRGLAFAHGHLYVADAGNDALRRVDAGTGEVRTIASGGGLSFPLGVVAFGPYVAVGAPGARQVWAYDPASGRVGPIAGTGADGVADGPAHAARLEQPAGLAFADDETGQRLWLGEAEAGLLRAFEAVDDEGPRIATVVHLPAGTRPLGLVAVPGGLAIADGGRHRILRWDAASGAIATLAGGEEPGLRDGTGAEARLREPAALALLGDALLVADAGNHALRRVDLATGAVETLPLVRLTPPRVVPRRERAATAPGGGLLELEVGADAAPLAVAAAFDEGGAVVRRAAGPAPARLAVPVPAAGGTLRVQARAGVDGAARERSLVVEVTPGPGGPLVVDVG